MKSAKLVESNEFRVRNAPFRSAFLLDYNFLSDNCPIYALLKKRKSSWQLRDDILLVLMSFALGSISNHRIWWNLGFSRTNHVKWQIKHFSCIAKEYAKTISPNCFLYISMGKE